MTKVRCNMCEWMGDEDMLSLVHIVEVNNVETIVATESRETSRIIILRKDLEGREFIDACPNCLTDNYLMNL